MKRGVFLAFVAPSVAMMLLFIAAPLIGVAWQSFHNTERVYRTEVSEQCSPGFPDPVCTTVQSSVPVMDARGVPQTRTVAVGWRNYAEMLDSPTFHQALRFTLVFTFVALPLVLLLGLALALALNSILRALRGRSSSSRYCRSS